MSGGFSMSVDISTIPNLKSDPLRYCLKNNLLDHDGLWLEFGTWKGQTLDLISQYTENVVYGFDTFSGLDYSWQGTLSGSMKFFDIGGIHPTSVIPINPDVRNGFCGEERPFRDNVEFVCGLFEDTLSDFLLSKNRKISFIHIDCDIYESTKVIFEFCFNFLKNGCVVVFDELVNYDGYENHELKALTEFMSVQKVYRMEWIGMEDSLGDMDCFGSSVACKFYMVNQ